MKQNLSCFCFDTRLHDCTSLTVVEMKIFNVPIVCTVTLYNLKASEYFETLPQFSYLFNRNAFICMVRRSCSQTTSVICFSAHKQWLNCSIVSVYKNKPESTKILIILIIKEDSRCKVSTMNLNITMETTHAEFPWEFKILKKYNQHYLFFHVSMKLG